MWKLKSLSTVLASLACVAAFATAAQAQSAIGGTVKDTSGAVLPGVTVEVASPVLIEKTKSVSTDGEGKYQVVDLRPGIYTITCTLQGFNTFKREALELPSNFVATVNADLKVGALEESVTVSGSSPSLTSGNRRRSDLARCARRRATKTRPFRARTAHRRRHARRLTSAVRADAAGVLRPRLRRVGFDGDRRRPRHQRDYGRRRRDGMPQRGDDQGVRPPAAQPNDRYRHQHEPGAEGQRQPLLGALKYAKSPASWQATTSRIASRRSA